MTIAAPRTVPTVPTAGRDRWRARVGLLRSTPGLLGLAAAALAGLILAFGVSAAMAGQDQRASLDGLASSSQSLGAAAQQIYRSLSDADAAAASAFLAGGLEPAPVRDRYRADIAAAEVALATANQRSAGEAALTSPLRTLYTELPVYTGLVERARVDNRQGLPVGAAYLREASGLLRTRLLPAAQDVYSAESARVAVMERRAAAFPMPAALVGLLTLVALVVAQVYLARRTNRVLSLGLLAASCAVVASLAWTAFAATTVSGHVAASRGGGSALVDTLARARIAALEARGDETLALVAHGEAQSYEQHFAGIVGTLVGAEGAGGVLDQVRTQVDDPRVRAPAGEAFGDSKVWVSAHERVRALYAAGRYNDAVQAAIGPDETSSGTAFGRVDGDLDRAIRAAAAGFDREVTTAKRVLDPVPAGLALLTVLAVGGTAFAGWQRMREYW
ncbi:hypothetical protein [Gandjariella thermophila]|uniref:Secreted protein n=1 Tax=Gandjariella thermophila TaxID=1931992 RepID=A0A4D4J4T5_9PSEU|nr:hypothetical protein [Gandjariella thermophila]GDY29546.1 hypothetical protein GTS_11790 [Gandjariella thermophila]